MEENISYVKEKYSCSHKVLVKITPHNIGIFRFLLESYDNLACFTVLDKYEGLVKVFFSPDQDGEVQQALNAIDEVIRLEISPWPFEECFQQPA